MLNLCKATRNLEPAVWFPRHGPMVEDFQRAGIECLNTVDVLRDPARTRDRFSLMHIHCGGHEAAAYRVARRIGISTLTTLHTAASLPELEGPLICVAPHVATIQDPYNRVRVIQNAVDPTEFTPGPSRSDDRIVVMRVCRPDRCAPYFWDAMRAVLQRHPEAELWIVGEAGVSDSSIRFFGSRGDVPDLLRQADIFAYAPLPDIGAHDLCVLEAMSAGVPPVITDAPCVHDSVRHLHDGIVVPFGNTERFAAAVERLIEEPTLRSSLAVNARRTAEERFSLDRLAADYLHAYDDALQARPDPAAAIRRNVRAFVIERTRIERFEKNLVLLYDTLAATAMAGHYWVIGGLLLGWAREGQVLRHDSSDADFALLMQDCPAFLKTFRALAGAGFESLARYVDNRGIAVEYSFRKDGTRFDFFLQEPVGENFRCTYFGMSPTLDQARPIQLVSLIPRYGLAAMEFLGRSWLKPDDHEAFLTAEYGDWRKPNPAFDHRSESPSLFEISWWLKPDHAPFEMR